MLSNIHICTINVQGLRDKQKRQRFYEWVKNQKCDIIFIQESHFDKQLENELKQETKNKCFFSNHTSASRGVCIMINSKLEYDIIDEYKDNDGRIILLNIEIHGSIYSFVNVYAPNNETDRKKFFKTLNDFVNKHAIGTLIIGGDINDTLEEKDRKYVKGKQKFKKPVISLKSFVKSNNLIDIWRHRNKQLLQFTWRRLNPPQASRIDLFLISKNLIPNIKSCDIRPALIKSTDHQAVSLKLENAKANNKGPGYWKLNNSILEDEDYCNIITNLINKYKLLFERGLEDSSSLWEKLKLEIRDISLAYCKNKSKQRKNEIINLENELKHVLVEYDGTNDSTLLTKITQLEKNIENHYMYKARGAQIRSRQEWVEKGEKNSAYFFGLEKSNQTKKTIIKLKNQGGKIVTDENEILETERIFYQNLYSIDKNNIYDPTDYIKTTELRYKLSDEESKSCDGYITLEELTKAVNNLKINKSPGLDGISTNFYKTFWKYLGPLLVNVFNDSYDKKCLPFTQRQSVLSLIYKKKRPARFSKL